MLEDSTKTPTAQVSRDVALPRVVRPNPRRPLLLIGVVLATFVIGSCAYLVEPPPPINPPRPTVPRGEPPVVIPPAGQGPGGGQFLVQCNEPIMSAAFDPIVYPGQTVAGHNHEFYGNRSITPSSGFSSLNGQATSCDESGDSAGYWHPTVYSNGVRKVAPKSTFYYDSPLDGPVHSYPDGLKMIAGDHMATSPQDDNIVNWGCGNGSGQSSLDFPPECDGGDLTFHVVFPNCWNGRTLDSADHKSHVAYGDDGDCPSSHPVTLPRLTIRIQFTDWRPDPDTLSLSNGSVNAMHADFFQSWVPAQLRQAVDACINAGKDCSADDVIDL